MKIEITDNKVIIDGQEYQKPEVKTVASGWRAEKGECYWTVASDNPTNINEGGHSFDDWLYFTGNYFKTEQEAKEYTAYLEAVATIKAHRRASNGERKLDWDDVNTKKWFIAKTRRVLVIDYFVGAFAGNSISGYYVDEPAIKDLIKKYGKELSIVAKYINKQN